MIAMVGLVVEELPAVKSITGRKKKKSGLELQSPEDLQGLFIGEGGQGCAKPISHG